MKPDMEVETLELAKEDGGGRRLAGELEWRRLLAAFDASGVLLNDALDSLTAHDARKAELVKQWYFLGLTIEQAAAAMGISERTALRAWAYARAWLVNEIEQLRG